MNALRTALIARGLTNRQAEVSELVATGLSNKEVANQLFVTEKTIKFHLVEIYRTLDIKSRAQLIILCLPLLGFVEADPADETATFVAYVLSFYGPGQMYADYFKQPVTAERVQAATATLKASSHNWGGGDTVDREAVRDIMLKGDQAAPAPVKRGLMVFVLRAAGGSCTNGGVTDKYDKFILIGDGVPEVFAPSEDIPALHLIRRNIGGREYLHAGTEKAPRGGMNGGNYVHTSDSRFPIDYPIAVHDRFEGGF